ncbi:DUF3139 domain-containing protein [Paenibacillus sp. MER 99-2]|uniref:DUF3139 domain-containing protein n=1 Tax=Paenibacillus sp. MER 99-2 TaxID=2939572 RepID=UPI00203BD012|nr:DUF3139 domain-containing protein [Paenibacillus sp. MER 99-2]MCM3172822.1 DUF3139 domain-containing protein [Paenibacillus sp. MER 99-2]
MNISKPKLVLSLLITLVALVSLYLWNFQRTMELKVEAYLLSSKEYGHEDIQQIDTHFGKAPLVSTEVIFKDEPLARYFYQEENGQIYQYSSAPVKGVDPNFTYRHLDPVRP